METEHKERVESIYPLFMINEEIKSKPKTKLTAKLKERIDIEMNNAVQNDGNSFIEKLLEHNEKWTNPVKQGIVSYFISNPPIEIISTRIIDLLNLYKDSARDRDHLQYLSILGLIHYREPDDQDGHILKRWIGSNETNNKTISLKIVKLFQGQNIHDIVFVLVHCKLILPDLEVEQFDKIKKIISDVILSTKSNDERKTILEDLDTLQAFMGTEFWVPSVKDEMLNSNIKTLRDKMTKSPSSTQSSELRQNISLKENLLKEVTPHVSTTNELQPNLKKDETDKLDIQKSKDITFDDRKKSTAKEKSEIPAKEERDISIVISKSKLTNKQEGLLKSIIETISNLNIQTSKDKETIGKLMKEIDILKKRQTDLSEELNMYQEDNQEKDKLLDELRSRLSKQRRQSENINATWDAQKTELEAVITQEKNENSRIKGELINLKKELERERSLSHATHKDAINRADVELETKMKAISQSVINIFREIEEFENIEELPQRAKMLMNINKKIKNALIANGVKL